MACPNKGPGRYEGEAYPCLTARFDQAPEWSDEDFTDGDDTGNGETISFFKAPDNGFTAEGLADLSGEDEPLCAQCEKALATHIYGVSLTIDRHGFRTLTTYPMEDDYEAAAKHAEKASLEAMGEDDEEEA